MNPYKAARYLESLGVPQAQAECITEIYYAYKKGEDVIIEEGYIARKLEKAGISPQKAKIIETLIYTYIVKEDNRQNAPKHTGKR